ncbi:MAG: hypothetical protein KC469_10515, partial [Flavobacteriaceae bacterium]|nr:hypothetical protein [Flavobacteriaceae bacterium]
MNYNVTVIIRSVGERTTDACFKIISKQVPKTHIHIISEVPFSKAVTETFKIAIRENRNWTLAVDADLLL